jgi:uncharacterized protein with PQ loop repeat
MADSCVFEPVPWYGITFGIVIAIGICVSFIPQHFVFIRTRSADGVSFLMVWISTVAAFAVFIATVIFSWQSILCCAHYVRLAPFDSDSNDWID